MVTVGVTGIGTGDAGADPAGVSHALTPSPTPDPAPGTERLAAEDDRSAWPGMQVVSRGGDLGGRAGGRHDGDLGGRAGGRRDGDDEDSGWESADCGLAA